MHSTSPKRPSHRMLKLAAAIYAPINPSPRVACQASQRQDTCPSQTFNQADLDLHEIDKAQT